MNTNLPTDHLDVALAAAFGRPRTLLDVGCGAGVKSMAARTSGTRVTGLELDRALAERARRVLHEVFVVDPSDEQAVREALGGRRFDLVVMGDLLERAASPDRLVAHFVRYLEPEGRMAVSLHNSEAWPRRLGLADPRLGYPSDAPSRRWFTRDQARRLLANAGLEVLVLDHNPMLLKALRGWFGEFFGLTVKADEDTPTGFRDLDAYRLYLDWVRPLEASLARLAPRYLAFENVVVARRRPTAGPLSLTVGMLTMDEEPSVARMIAAIREQAPDAQVLCVDSSVRDETPMIAERLGARVLRQLPPRGHGPAMELLMYEAARQSDALIYLDCDFTYPTEVIPAIRGILESGVDVVNAARTRHRPRAMPWPNYAANRGFAWVGRVLGGAPVADLHSGMRGYRSSVIRAFAFDGTGDAIPIDTLLWPARSGFHVVEVPIDYQERLGASKLRKLSGTVWTFIRLGRTLGVGRRGQGTYEVWETLAPPSSRR
jgi:SAM-dependent methyltransferase